MIFLIFFAFLGGVVTILSPCILPILPVVLSGTVSTGKRRPFGIVAGFVLSFTFFTLFLSAIVKATGISADFLRSLSVFVIFGFGLSLLVPKFQELTEKLFSKLSSLASAGRKNEEGFVGGILIGLSLGLIWTPCVGPILASIITLAATSDITAGAFIITLAYAVGTAIPMLAVMYGGRSFLSRVPGLVSNTSAIQKAFGILMILTAIAIHFNFDRSFQAYILEKFPDYGTGLTKLEDNQTVKDQLEKLKSGNQSLNQNAPELIEGGQWFNSLPLRLSELKGKVVLIDFWTYTCINCIRTLPYIKSWHEKYKDKGLVIIGVHTPEFEFEKNPINVERAIKDFSLNYPIMQDNNYETWNSFRNRYWPAKYFIDREGRLRFTHFGEGEYDESERLIQDLLKEAGAVIDDIPVSNQAYDIESRTPETYLGYERIDNFSSNEDIREDVEFNYSIPKNLSNNHFAIKGTWKIRDEKAEPMQGATLILDFESKNVHLVMGSKNKVSGKVRVYLDDMIVSEISVYDYQLYDLIKLGQPGRHVLKLEFIDSNLELFAFTFG